MPCTKTGPRLLSATPLRNASTSSSGYFGVPHICGDPTNTCMDCAPISSAWATPPFIPPFTWAPILGMMLFLVLLHVRPAMLIAGGRERLDILALQVV